MLWHKPFGFLGWAASRNPVPSNEESIARDRVMNPNNHPQPPATNDDGLRVADNKTTHERNKPTSHRIPE